MAGAKPDLPPIGAPILELDSINKAYGDVLAAQDVSLSIPRGSIFGFLGPNGAGKTTTIRSIMGIIIPDSGTITYCYEPLDRRVRDTIGYLPEERGLYRKMKCIDQLVYLAQLKGVPRNTAFTRSREWLDRLGLAEWSDRKVDVLSKGMQQKIQFASTFISEPDLVILDEPFSGLDPLNIELLRELILEQKQQGTTIIFSTHMLAEAEKICDAICLIEGGKKILDGTLEQVRQQFPLQSVRVAYADDSELPADLPGVVQSTFEEGTWRLTLEKKGDVKQLLALLTAAGQISFFSANRPTLSEVFLTAVRRQRAAAGTEERANPATVQQEADL